MLEKRGRVKVGERERESNYIMITVQSDAMTIKERVRDLQSRKRGGGKKGEKGREGECFMSA